MWRRHTCHRPFSPLASIRTPPAHQQRSEASPQAHSHLELVIRDSPARLPRSVACGNLAAPAMAPLTVAGILQELDDLVGDQLQVFWARRAAPGQRESSRRSGAGRSTGLGRRLNDRRLPRRHAALADPASSPPPRRWSPTSGWAADSTCPTTPPSASCLSSSPATRRQATRRRSSSACFLAVGQASGTGAACSPCCLAPLSFLLPCRRSRPPSC